MRDKKNEFHKRELMVRSVDLLSTFLENLSLKFELYVKNSNILNIIAECIEDKDFQVRQFILSFVGELAKRCPNILQGKIALFVPIIVKNLYILPADLDPNLCYLAICNNTSWAIGEIAIAYPNEIKPFIPDIAQKLVELIQTPKVN